MINRVLAAAAALLALAALGCGAEEFDAGDGMEVSLWLAPLDSNCSASAGVAYTEVHVSVRDSDLGKVVKEKTFKGLPPYVMKVPEGTDLEVTCLGYTGGDAPTMYARGRNIIISKDKTTEVDLTGQALSGFTCVDAPGNAPNVLFPAVTNLPDGRVLVTGGFMKVKDTQGRYEIFAPSQVAYIYDPTDGSMRQADNLMNRGRGAHTAVYIPQTQQVLLVGGADMLFWDKGGEAFPLYFEKAKVGTVGKTYELFDTRTETFVSKADMLDTGEAENDVDLLYLPIPRVFPVAVVNNQGTVLVTGGGLWPSAAGTFEQDDKYQQVELYVPRITGVTESEGFVNNKGVAMMALRTGHTAVQLETPTQQSVYLFWGGNIHSDQPVAEIYTASSKQLEGDLGNFTQLSFTDGDSYKKRPFFQTMTPLASRRFLLAGGVNNSKGDLKVPSVNDAYLVTVDSNNVVTTEKIDGLGTGRYLHTASSWDNKHVVLMGGFTSVTQGEQTLFSDMATADVKIFDLNSKTLSNPDADDTMIPRGGGRATVLPNDCIFMAGGVDAPALGLDNSGDIPALLTEVYCPRTICPEGLWNSVCSLDE
ncbi:MAG: hypothetical protein ABIK09_17400 [Pseudomonadota bacterium]